MTAVPKPHRHVWVGNEYIEHSRDEDPEEILVCRSCGIVFEDDDPDVEAALRVLRDRGWLEGDWVSRITAYVEAKWQATR